jgi:acyl dehydratase
MALDLSAVGARSAPHVFSYAWKDAVLYALSIGARRDELAYLYEAHGPRVYPTFAVIPAMAAVNEGLARTGAELEQIVHGAQELTLHAPLPPSGTLHTTGEVKAIHDMKKLAQIVVGTETRGEDGALLAETEWVILVRGAGNFGGKPPPRKVDETPVPKDRPADFRLEEPTSPEQALLYRLTGDLNPLHADPDLAARVGFPQGPILHGLCTFGHLARALIKVGLGGDASRLQRLGAQFRRPVWPGDTLVSEGFFAGNRVALQTFAQGRPEPVLTSAWAQVKDPSAAE